MYVLCENGGSKPLPKIPLAWLTRHELGGERGENVLVGYGLRRKLIRPQPVCIKSLYHNPLSLSSACYLIYIN